MGRSSDARASAVGRGRKMRAAVLAATVTELASTGYAALSVEGVARRAGVHKTTIYRNWEDLDALLVEALAGHFAEDVPVPDTGTLEGDLRELVRSLVAALAGDLGRALVATVLSDAARSPELAAVKRAVFGDRFVRAAPVVTRGVDRGELPVGTDPEALLTTLSAPIWFRLVCTDRPVDDSTADQAVRVALAAARAGALAR